MWELDNKKRLAIQGLAALIQNADLKGFFTGQISQSATKAFCVPGLNCYSCPGAVGACPIGALQNSLSGMTFRFPYYVLGLLIFFGAFLGRAVCGFLCPFGLLQDLLNKIPFPKKIRTFKADRGLRRLKYVVLAVLVIIVPVFAKMTPAFCKYLCPSGTLSGILLALADSRLFAVLGSTFAWKVSVLVAIVLLAIAIYRPFCKYLCPLGAFYAPFNKVAFMS
ncbi:MAG: 4Fe-4S binding protein, partial [Clostridiales bacterium]|nr:4Fe-4S binding protein [Clostridiales bacterium]